MGGLPLRGFTNHGLTNSRRCEEPPKRQAAVLALERIGIIEIQQLKASRRYVYFGMAIVAAMITPGGNLISMLGLTGPLILLYELGIWLCVIGRRKLDRAKYASLIAHLVA